LNSQLFPAWLLSPFITMNRVPIKFWSVLLSLRLRKVVRDLFVSVGLNPFAQLFASQVEESDIEPVSRFEGSRVSR
jgi:hypothetical protein